MKMMNVDARMMNSKKEYSLLLILLTNIYVIDSATIITPESRKFNPLDEELLEELYTFADISRVKELIKSGANVNATENWGDKRSALMIALEKNHTNIAKQLINEGADVNATDLRNRTALDFAIYFLKELDLNLFEALLKKGANVNHKDNDGYTPLIEAADRNNSYEFDNSNLPDLVNLLIDAGADVNVANNDGITPLMAAAGKGHNGIIELLVQNKANINAKNLNGEDAFLIAFDSGHRSIAFTLLKHGANINSTDNDGNTALMNQIIKKNPAGIFQLIKSGADLSIKNKEGLTALDLAQSNTYYNKEISDMLAKELIDRSLINLPKTVASLISEYAIVEDDDEGDYEDEGDIDDQVDEQLEDEQAALEDLYEIRGGAYL